MIRNIYKKYIYDFSATAEKVVEEYLAHWCLALEKTTSNRCYRKAHNFDYCYEEIEKNLGKMYDPIVGIDVLDNWDEITSVVNR